MAHLECCRETETSIFAARTNLPVLYFQTWQVWCAYITAIEPMGKDYIKKNKNSTQNKSQTQRATAYKVTSFLLSTYCEMSTDTCSKYVYSPVPMLSTCAPHVHYVMVYSKAVVHFSC